MKDIKLYTTDFVLYDKANDSVVCFSDGYPIIYGIKEEAIEDCYGNESVVSCTDLPKHQQEFIINKIKLNKMPKTKKKFKLLDRVDDGFNYFLDHRLEELKSDDKHYINSFIDYIEYLEIKVDRLSKQLITK